MGSMRTGKKLETMNRYLTIVSAMGFVGLAVSLFLLSDYWDQTLKLLHNMMDTLASIYR